MHLIKSLNTQLYEKTHLYLIELFETIFFPLDENELRHIGECIVYWNKQKKGFSEYCSAYIDSWYIYCHELDIATLVVCWSFKLHYSLIFSVKSLVSQHFIQKKNKQINNYSLFSERKQKNYYRKNYCQQTFKLTKVEIDSKSLNYETPQCHCFQYFHSWH